jgi:hypothetical protein
VLLWFGSWKNGVSSYVPSWVRADPARFPVQHVAGRATSVLSPFAPANAEIDATAFASFMGHLRDQDREGTVLMVQVENEVGTLGDSRDRSMGAEAAWRSPVPHPLLVHINEDPEGCREKMLVTLGSESTSWPDAFGDGVRTDELFMAWHYASYIERVAQAGRVQHDLPLFVNAWLDAGGEKGPVSGGDQPGTYPSGGPLPHVAGAWPAAAPPIDFLAPDIYAADAEHWLDQFSAVTPTLFVPELRRSAAGMETIFLAVGSFRPWPGGLPASPSVTGLVRFSLLAPPET